MKLSGVKIAGTGSYLPEKIMTNNELEKLVETSDEWIKTRTGISERRIIDENMTTSDLGAFAAKEALKDAGISADDVELVICATFSPDMLFPATACIIQDKIGAKKAGAFDVEAACTGFISAFATGCQFVQTGMYKNVLVVAAEANSRIVDWTDRNTCCIFGDGAGACVLQPCEYGHGALAHSLHSDGGGGGLLYMSAGGAQKPASEETVKNREHFLRMAGSEIFKLAVKSMSSVAVESLEKCGLTVDDMTMLIPHQANIRIINAVGKALGLDESKVFVNIDKYGNTSAATIIIAIDELKKSGRLNKGDILVLSAFGGGLTWGSSVIKWV